MNTAETRLKELGREFPAIKMKGQGVVPYKLVDGLLMLGGVAPVDIDGQLAFVGRVGAEFTVEEGYKAARLVGLNALRIIKDALGSLDRVDYVVKAMVMVSAVPGFEEMYRVADGFSDALTEALGERGVHARNAVGASTLNGNAPVICDVLVKVRA
jgi:enamine deaminase RidA (YjgF/YER057c/UK114 family)